MRRKLRELTGLLAVTTALTATTATAQSVFEGTDVAEERNEDLLEAIEDDAERDLDRFGNEGRAQGFSGSVALRAVAASGNTDSLDVGIGGEFNYLAGPNGFELELNYSYGEDDGEKNEESLFYGLQYTRDLNPRLYGFAKVQGSVDEFSSFETDTFGSVGLGYRVIDTGDTQWSLQAGPGYRFAELSLDEQDIDEWAFGATSNFAHRFSSGVMLTNDTDVIHSDADTAVFNDLAVSVSVSDGVALRTSVLTEHHSDPLPGFEETDNTYGVSLVFAL